MAVFMTIITFQLMIVPTVGLSVVILTAIVATSFSHKPIINDTISTGVIIKAIKPMSVQVVARIGMIIPTPSRVYII